MHEQVKPPLFIKWIIALFISFMVGSALSGGCSYLNRKVGLQDDNVLEQAAEAYIRSEYGLDLDLSPDY